MTQAKECSTRLISDLPAEQDAFGPHEKVAKAIADLILNEDGGKTIALRGGWGSGKSSVVNFLKRHLAEHKDTTVWVFDAWAHQGDPLRRTFLERLIIHLVEKGWANKETWEEQREELAHRRKITDTEEIPKLTVFATMLALLLGMLPIGTALFGSGLPDNWALAGPGLAIMLAPISAILAYALWAWRRPSKARDHSTPWALFVSKTVTRTRTETIEQPDPTSVEFEDRFARLMMESLAAEERRMVLVLDNLDRVDADNALSIWSTLQTFLHHEEHDEPDWFKKLWVLIPHDPDGIRRLWKDSKSSTTNAPAFLDKSFQVRFDVPPPVLSDWHAYLLKMLKVALPRHNEAEFHEVYSIFAHHEMKAALNPSPRDLKLYVNDLSALHCQRNHDIPLSHLAYYVLLRRTDQDVPKGLLQGEVPEPELLASLGKDIRKNLAALAFGAEVERGQQLLLADPIQRALDAGDAAALAEIAQNVPEGFWEVLEFITARGLGWKTEPPRLARAALALLQSGLFVDGVRPEAGAIRQNIEAATVQVRSWSPFDEATAGGIVSLCRLLDPDPEFVRHLLNGVSASEIHPTGGSAAGAVPASVWGNSFLIVVRGLQALGLLRIDGDLIYAPADAKAWVEVCDEIARQDPERATWRFLRPQASAADVPNVLADLARHAKFSRQAANGVKVSIGTGIVGGWADLVTAFSERLTSADPIPAEEIAASFEALWDIRPIEASTDELLGRLVVQGFALHHLAQASSERNDEALAWCMFVFLSMVPGLAPPPEVGQSGTGHSVLLELLSNPGGREATASAFMNLLSRLGELDILFTMLDANEASRPFVAYCLRILSQSPDAGQLLTPQRVVERWPLLVEIFDAPELNSLVERLCANTDLVSYVQGTTFDPDLAGLYISLVRAGAASQAAYRSWCLSGLKVVTKDLWLTQLSQSGELLTLIVELQRQGTRVTLEHEYQDALAEHGGLLASGDMTVELPEYAWNELLKPLRRDLRKVLRRRLYNAMVTVTASGGRLGTQFFTLYDEELSNSELLRAHSDAPSGLFVPILQNRDLAGLEWIAGLSKSKRQVFAHFRRDAMLEFKDSLRRALQADPGDNASSVIQEIAEALQVKASEAEEAPSD